jgi:methylthioribose-1-phosphate isomerase
VPFYVAGPLSSFDPGTPSGEQIVIEQRAREEITDLDVAVWNPVFDVTPHELVTAFVTDAGVLRPPYESSIAKAFADNEASLTRR